MSSSKSSIAEQSATPATTKDSIQKSKKNTLKRTLVVWLQLNSFRGKLFWMIMLGALTGVGGMAFLFSEMIKYQAEDQVRSSLAGKVNAIASVTEAAETLAYGLGISATTLHERQAQFPDTYRELTLQLFERRPQFVVGLGLGQRENGLIVDQPWLFPYYWVESSKPGPSTQQAPIRYEDFADDVGVFYPDSDRYQNYFLPQNTVWTLPYQREGTQVLTHYFQLFSSDSRWLGTTLVDIDIHYLSELIDQSVFRNQGSFTLLTRSGTIIADPSNPENNLKTYQDIPDLADLWQQAGNQDTGFLEGETGYWAYATVPGQDWLLFGFVPYGAVFSRIALITMAATALMVVLLTIAILLAVRNLNRRLRPVLNQCNQLARADSQLLDRWNQEDDLNQLSLAFFNMLEQLNLNEETIRRHEQKIERESLFSERVSDRLTEFTTMLKQQAGKQQQLVRQVQQLVDEVANESQSVDIQLDALNTMGRALNGEIKRTPSQSVEMLDMMEQQMHTLVTMLDSDAAQNSKQLQELTTQLAQNIATLKASDKWRSSLDNLQQQVEDITQTGQVASSEARAIVASTQSIAQMLNKIEQISTTFVRRARSVTEPS